MSAFHSMMSAFRSLVGGLTTLTGIPPPSPGKKISSESRSDLLDSAAATNEAADIQRSLVLLRKNGAALRYSSDSASLPLPPSDARKREKLLAGLPEVPEDNRQSEVLVALTALAILTGSFVTPLFDQDSKSGVISLLLFALALVLDNFVSEPAGALTSTFFAGLTRLFTRDVTRECRCESASFLVGYHVGIPAFSLSPNTVEALRLTDPTAAESMADSPEADLASTFSTPGGVNRILVWLMAGVAAEAAEHRQLIVSDPRQASALLKILRTRDAASETQAGNDDSDDEFRLRSALAQAELLLRKYGNQQDQLRQRMESGGATVSNCIALLEKKA